MTVVRDQLFPQKPPGSRFRFSRTGVQPSPGSSTIELPSALAESGAYPPDRELQGSPRQCSLPLAYRHPLEGHQIGARKRRTPENTILSQPYCRRVSTDRPNRESSQLAASLEGEPGPTPAGKTVLLLCSLNLSPGWFMTYVLSFQWYMDFMLSVVCAERKDVARGLGLNYK